LEWSGSVHRTTLEPVQTNRHNTEANLLVLEAAKRLRIPMTFASTCVYSGESARPMREGDAINVRSLYVAQKLYAESCVKAYASMFGLSACSLRVFNVYGTDGAPFQILPRIKEALRTGTPITLTGDGGQVRDFIHSEDVAAAFCRSIGKTFQGEAFNVGTGTGTSMLELIQMAMAVTGKQIPIEFTPAKGEEARFLIADTRQAALSLGFQTSITLEQGLEHILN
jgi:UDP-glucose 4-epimerase